MDAIAQEPLQVETVERLRLHASSCACAFATKC